MATKKITPITEAPSHGKSKAMAKPGTAIAIKAGSNVVSIKEAMAAQLAALADKTAPATGNMIRTTQDKQFILPDGTKTPGPLELVIVDFASKNSFWEEKFDPKNIKPVACFAMGSNPLKLVPSAKAPLPQASDCGSCPNNQFGSDGDGKACKNTRVLAVLPPDATEDTPLWLLATSPTANKGFDGFVTSVARVFQMPPVGVVATVGFDPNVTYAKLVFSDPQPNANLEVHFARQAEAQALLEVEPDVSGFVPMSKAPARKAVGGRR